jgi:hypothetical protein
MDGKSNPTPMAVIICACCVLSSRGWSGCQHRLAASTPGCGTPLLNTNAMGCLSHGLSKKKICACCASAAAAHSKLLLVAAATAASTNITAYIFQPVLKLHQSYYVSRTAIWLSYRHMHIDESKYLIIWGIYTSTSFTIMSY